MQLRLQGTQVRDLGQLGCCLGQLCVCCLAGLGKGLGQLQEGTGGLEPVQHLGDTPSTRHRMLIVAERVFSVTIQLADFAMQHNTQGEDQDNMMEAN